MINFSVNGKELKTMVDKVMTVVPKKSSIPALGAVYFKVEDGNLSVFATDLEQWLEVSTNWAMKTEDGIIGVDVDNIKILTNFKDEVECTGIQSGDEWKMRVKSNKKMVNIPAMEYDADTNLYYEETSPSLRDMTCLMEESESWMYDTFTKLSNFLSVGDSNKLMGAYDINLNDGRVETLDGHRIGTRNIPYEVIREGVSGKYTVNYTANTVFKKLLDKKSDANVEVYGNDNFVLFKGENFRYLMRRMAGEYWNLNNMLRKHESDDISFVVDRDELMAVAKYDADLAKDTRKPLIICGRDGELYCYISAYRYEVFDSVYSDIKDKNRDFMFGINPRFVMDALQVVDSDKPYIYGANEKSPWMIVGCDYNLLLLPVVIDRSECEAGINRCLEENNKKEA